PLRFFLLARLPPRSPLFPYTTLFRSIASTASPLPILGKGAVERALKQRRHKPMFMVDIAVPRDIEPEVGDLPDVYLYSVDDLRRSEEHTSELQSRENLVCRLLLEKKN